jgi:hypothetical protein
MNCTDADGNLVYVTSTLGRRGVGVVQPQSGLDYPFTAPSEDIRYLVADLDVAVDDSGLYAETATEFQPPFRIKNLYGAGCIDNAPAGGFLTPTHDVDIVIVDAANRTVFDSTEADTTFSQKPWGNDYSIIRWGNTRGQCSILLYTTWPQDDAEQRHYNKYLTPQNAIIDTRAVYVIPKRLRSIRVTDVAGLEDIDTAEKITGAFVLENGYNTELTSVTAATNFVNSAAITISAAAGTGLGKFSNCADSGDEIVVRPITKINGVAIGETGDFLFGATDCLWAHRPTTETDGAVTPTLGDHMELGAGCNPCCECQDYVDVGLQINQYRSQYANIGNRVYNTKQIHEQNIQKWLDQRACGLDHPLRLLLVPQRCPYMDIVCMVCNPCTECLYVRELSLALTAPEGVTADLELGYTALFAANINGRPTAINKTTTGGATVFNIPFPIVRAGDSAYIRFRIKFSEASEYAVTGVLTATLNTDDPVLTGCADNDEADRRPAAATASQALYCDADGNTNLP